MLPTQHRPTVAPGGHGHSLRRWLQQSPAWDKNRLEQNILLESHWKGRTTGTD